MAVSENDLVVGPLTPAAGVTTISLDFYFEQASWLEVYKAGSETPLVLNTDYTVTGAGTSSGVVTLTTPANGTDAYSIYLAVPLQRSSDMQLRGEFKSEPFNVEMDRIWQRLQHHNTLLGRTLRVGRNDDAPKPYAPEPETVAGFDAVGAPTLYPVNAAVTLNLDPDDAVRRDNVATVIADTVMGYTAGASVQVSAGQYVLTTQEGFLYEVAASGATDHHVTTAGGVKLRVAHRGTIIAAAFGDLVSAPTATVQRAIDVAIAAGISQVNLTQDLVVSNLSGLDQVRLVSMGGPFTITVGSSVFAVPFLAETSGPVSLYVATTGSDSTQCGMSSGTPFATVQQALDFLPANIMHDVVINVADGTYDDQGGQDEWGRPVVVDLSKKAVNPLRDTSIPLNSKAAKIRIVGASEAGTIIDGSTIGARYCFWVHGVKDIQLEDMTLTGAYGGLISHQGSDVMMYDVTTTGNAYGLLCESQSRIEKIRGTVTGNTNAGLFLAKNSFLQWNDGSLTANVGRGAIIVANSASMYLLRVDGAAAAGRDYIHAKGAGKIELDDCDSSGGRHFITGTCIEARIKNGTRIRNFTSSVCALAAGYFVSDKNGSVNHIHSNAFVAYLTEGAAIVGLRNCDSLNASSVDEPNTNGIRSLSYAASHVLDPNVSVASADKMLTRPSSGLVFKGTSPPTDASVFYERGAMCFNEAAAVGQPAFWVVTTRGYGGSVVWTPGPNL